MSASSSYPFPSDSLHTETNYTLMKQALWPAFVYVVVMMLLGLVGNSLVLIVYRHHFRTSVTRMFIYCLALLDMANCLFTMPAELVILFRFTDFPSPLWCKLTRFLTYTFNGSSSIILTAIALDRYNKVCHPERVYITVIRARLGCILAVLSSGFFAIPALVLYGEMEMPFNLDHFNYTGRFCLVKSEYMDTSYPLMFYIFTFSVYLSMVGSFIVFYAHLLRKVYIQKRRYTKMFNFFKRGSKFSPNGPNINNSEVLNHEEKNSNNVMNGKMTVRYVEPSVGTLESCEIFDEKPATKRSGERDGDQAHKISVSSGDNEVFHKYPNNDEIQNSVVSTVSNKTAISFRNKSRRGYSHQISKPESHDEASHVIVRQESKSSKYHDNMRNSADIDLTLKRQRSASKKKSKRVKERVPRVKVIKPEGTISKRNFVMAEVAEENSLLSRRIQSLENLHRLSLANIHSITPGKYNTLATSSNIITTPPLAAKEWSSMEITSSYKMKDAINPQSDWVTEEPDDLTPWGPGSPTEKTLTLKRNSPQGKKRICVLPLTGLSSKTALQDGHIAGSPQSEDVSPITLSTEAPMSSTSQCSRPQSVLSQSKEPELNTQFLMKRHLRKSVKPFRTSRMLLIISLVFVGSFLPFFVIALLRASLGYDFFDMTSTQLMFVSIFLRSSLVSNAVNPIVYAFFNMHFRQQCLALFRRILNRIKTPKN